MQHEKRWSFGFGTLFSLIIIYFIYLYSKDKGWTFLAFISKIYLIIVGGIFALTILMILIVVFFSLILIGIGTYKARKFNKNSKRKEKEFVDVEFREK
jgi:predicted membrane protein